MRTPTTTATAGPGTQLPLFDDDVGRPDKPYLLARVERVRRIQQLAQREEERGVRAICISEARRERGLAGAMARHPSTRTVPDRKAS